MVDVTSEVSELQRRVWEAANRRDLALLERLLDEDFVLVEADSLERKSRADFLAELAAQGEDEGPLGFELLNVKVQAMGEMAVAYAQFHCQEEIDGERLGLSGNAVDVFVRRQGAWKLAGSVYGEVPPFTE